MLALNCDNISLAYGASVILENINFSLNDKDKLGIIGVNGAGKSSLFSIITGKISQTSGNVFIAKDKSIGILEQVIDYESSNSILDEAYSAFSELLEDEKKLECLRNDADKCGDESSAKKYSDAHERFVKAGGYEFRGRCKGILKNLGLDEDFWDKPVTSLSGGQKTRLSLACTLLRDPDILLLDEPTNHLDVDALFWLEGYIKSSKKVVLIISHDRYFLDSTVNKILEIENKKSKLYNGNYSEYVSKKETDRQIQQKHYDDQQKEIKRIEAYIEQQRRWNREKNIIAAESRQKMLDKMERVERPENLPQKIKMNFEKSGESGNDVLTVTGLSKCYPAKKLFLDADFQIKKNDRLFIVGNNGCGKSTLVKILAGRECADSGHAVRGYNVRIGYYDQENQDLDPSNTVLEELWKTYPTATETVIRSSLARFLFNGDDIEKKVSQLSGGEKSRLTFAKLMLSKMNLLILDEPTNHLDINSKEILEKALLEFDGTIVAVSHDRYFINKLATGILDFSYLPDNRLYLYNGNYSDYIKFKNEHPIASEQNKSTSITASKEQYLNSKRDQAEKRKYEHKIQITRDSIAETENEIDRINREISETSGYDYQKLTELSELLAKEEDSLLELYETLDELEKNNSNT